MANAHRFQVGELTCVALHDGEFTYSAEQYFPSAPDEPVAQALAESGEAADAIPSPFTCLLVDTRDVRVLVDTGAGPLTPQLGQLPEALRAVGVEPTDVNVVVITHGHPDHIGGLMTDGSSTYPNARHMIMSDEWEHWADETILAGYPDLFAVSARENLAPLADRFELVSGEVEVVPGIEVIPMPGHTVGHCAVAATSGGEELLYVSDVAMHRLHLAHPDWHTAFDSDPAQALVSRRALFDRAATEGSLVLAYHFHPFPSLGRVSRSGDGWEWHPACAADDR